MRFLIGRNGVGKTQLLDAIANGNVSVSGLSNSEIEKYDIRTFQPRSSGSAGWGGSLFAESTAERYFSMKPGPAPVETAKTIFSDTLKDFQLGEGSKERHQFEEELRHQVRQMPDFGMFPNINKDAALSSYSKAILNDVIKPLKPKTQQGRTSRSDGKGSCGNDSAILVSLGMKLTASSRMNFFAMMCFAQRATKAKPSGTRLVRPLSGTRSNSIRGPTRRARQVKRASKLYWLNIVREHVRHG